MEEHLNGPNVTNWLVGWRGMRGIISLWICEGDMGDSFSKDGMCNERCERPLTAEHLQH